MALRMSNTTKLIASQNDITMTPEGAAVVTMTGPMAEYLDPTEIGSVFTGADHRAHPGLARQVLKP